MSRSAASCTALGCLLLVALLLAVSTNGCADAASIKKIAVLARSGARGELKVTSNNVTCAGGNEEDEACQLTETGRNMALLLGKQLKTRYGTLLNLPTHYNTTIVKTHGVNAQRYLQTAQLVIRGLYASSLPLVSYVQEESDTTLAYTKSWASWVMRDPDTEKLHKDDAWAKEKIGAANLPKLTALLPSDATITCESAPSLCARYLADTWMVNTSAGNDIPDALTSVLPQVNAVASRYLLRLYGVDPKIADDTEMGPLASNYLNSIWSYFTNGKTTQTVAISVVPVYMLSAAYANLGYLQESNFTTGGTAAPYPLPGFTEALILEYYDDDTVRAVRFTVDQTPNPSVTTFEAIPIHCTAGSNTYVSTQTASGGCPVADAKTYVDSLGAASSVGVCYVSDDTLAAQGCDGDDAPAAGSACRVYRVNCPGAQCGTIDGAIADPQNDYVCQEDQLNKDTPYLAATIVALVAPCLLAGAITGFYLSDKIIELITRRGKTPVPDDLVNS